ncbi:MAG TPA: asparaginase domain-containing protein [Verrucomicrobiales bacterium]|nr:asparaginase domain-containing protein [Verrucomicrobiales bacterium]
MNNGTQTPISGVRLLVTGGTIDKIYDAAEGRLGFEHTKVLEMLRQGRVPLPDACVQTAVLKDSLELVDADREAIAAACLASPEEHLVITHGTDTMVLTARHLAARVKGRTMVLTGAMVPFSVNHSDALFNFGFAFAAARLLPEGVYVAMNGSVFPWDRVEKNRASGWFEETGTVNR